MRLGLFRRIVVLALALVAFGSLATSASALYRGTGGWYWPTGTENFGGMSGWWDDRGGSWHLAQDMAAPCGSSVYAIGDGVVLESKYVARYGPGGSDGGAVVILHKTASGKEFKAVYGHLSNLRFSQGDTVQAGAVIGTVNNSSPNHLHFGIHPGETYPHDNNPFRGHTYNSNDDYGFVDPVKYLRENPRVIVYVAPPLPTVASVSTTTTPFGVGVVGGVAHWMDRSGEATQSWSYNIATRQLASRALEDTHSAFEVKRYSVSIARPGFTVRDRRPVLSLMASHSTPQPGGTVRLSGKLTNAKGQAFSGAKVTLQRLTSSGWMTVASRVSGSDGAYRFSYRPSRRTHLRVRFSPPNTYVTTVSATSTVAPHVTVTQPTLSPKAVRGLPGLQATGYLSPAHPTSTPVRFIFDRYVDGRWVRVGAKRAFLSQVDGRTLCSAWFGGSDSGTYRVRIFVPDDDAHAATYSPASTLRID